MELKTKDKIFLKFAATACFLSVLTTVGIHSGLFDFSQLTEQERLLLFQNPYYITSKFWIIVHCLFVLFSMCGMYTILSKKSIGFPFLGIVFFIVFAFTEIYRQMYVLFYLNGLKMNYVHSGSIGTELFNYEITNAGLIGNSLFGLFILCFALGNIFYGIALYDKNRIDLTMSILLIFWGIGNLLAFTNEFWQSKILHDFFHYFNLIFQPFIRILLSIWCFWKIDLIPKRTQQLYQ